jgi:hypothetical protein
MMLIKIDMLLKRYNNIVSDTMKLLLCPFLRSLQA